MIHSEARRILNKVLVSDFRSAPLIFINQTVKVPEFYGGSRPYYMHYSWPPRIKQPYNTLIKRAATIMKREIIKEVESREREREREKEI